MGYLNAWIYQGVVIPGKVIKGKEKYHGIACGYPKDFHNLWLESQNARSKFLSSSSKSKKEKVGLDCYPRNDAKKKIAWFSSGILYIRSFDADSVHHLPLHEQIYQW